MKLKSLSYATVACLLHGFFSVLLAITETARVYPQFQDFFFWSKIVFGFFSISLGIYVHYRGMSDKVAALLFADLISYCWLMMWFAPLYEFAYLQCAVGCSFIKLRRNWLFPVAWGIGLIGVLINYTLQDHLHWVLPPIVRSDYVFIMVIVFMLSWFIQKYAVGAYQLQQDRLSRFSLIGREATRLTHDIKGLMSSPMLIIDSLRRKDRKLSLADYEEQMVLLAEDMESIRQMLRSIQRLVSVEDVVTTVDVSETLHGPLQVFSRRLSKVKLVKPENRPVKGHPDRLHSLFFNLLLNSIEAFERNKTPQPEIQMFWEDNVFVYTDNAGGFPQGPGRKAKSSKGFGSGLGLEIVRTDLDKMGARLKIKSVPPRTRIEIRFVG